jgi:hypothetical protein
MISALPGENINIENAVHKSPTIIKLIFLFPRSPLTTKNIPTNNIKKYQKPINLTPQ